MKPKQKTLTSMFMGGADSLVFWTFRYFLGCRTIDAVGFAQELAKAWPLINAPTQAAIQKELEEEFIRDDAARNNPTRKSGSFPLGHTCDRAAWQKVRNAYLND